MISRRALPFIVLLIGIFAVASSSILIRFAQGLGVTSTSIAAWRLILAAIILLPIALTHGRAELRLLGRRELALGAVAGLFLALHFITWISSLEYTSVASSVALVSTNPLWVGLASLLIFRERLSRLTMAGIALTVGGSALIGLSDSGGHGAANALLGDALALLGAISVSIYYLIGRELRRTLGTLSYIWLVYSSGALVMVAISLLGALAQGRALASLAQFPPMGWALLLGLALGPQLMGHTIFNWALRHFSATFVTIALLGEPMGSALLALLLFGEPFQPLQLAGFAVLLGGIALATVAERAAKA
ncbi:DMT family transporter [Chloroflexia bacterium SDU3-3]|nr:DMT family transporter [Chloroflexia bacterium SDU3-3]